MNASKLNVVIKSTPSPLIPSWSQQKFIFSFFSFFRHVHLTILFLFKLHNTPSNCILYQKMWCVLQKILQDNVKFNKRGRWKGSPDLFWIDVSPATSQWIHLTLRNTLNPALLAGQFPDPLSHSFLSRNFSRNIPCNHQQPAINAVYYPYFWLRVKWYEWTLALLYLMIQVKCNIFYVCICINCYF